MFLNLTSSETDGTLLAIADTSNSLSLYNVSNGFVENLNTFDISHVFLSLVFSGLIWSLPSLSSPISAFTIHPQSILIATITNQIYLYDILTKRERYLNFPLVLS